MIKKKNYIWVSDYSNTTGEGNLAHLFIKIKLKKDFECVICKFKSKNKFYKIIFGYKYVLPLLGILNCWKYYLKGETVSYVNYLPLWNVIIFLLLPPKTILGPITGGSYFKKEIGINYLVRKLIFPIFYITSIFLLNFRNQKLFFSTSLLKKYFSSSKGKKNNFNFILAAIKPFAKSYHYRPIDFLIYFKNHKNKKKMYPLNFIKQIINHGYKVYVIGDQMHLKGLKNLGYQNKKKLQNFLFKTKFCIASTENIMSFFSVDCINNGVKIVSNFKLNMIDKKIRKNFIYLNTNISFKKQIKILNFKNNSLVIKDQIINLFHN